MGRLTAGCSTFELRWNEIHRVPPGGFEPPINGLKDRCATIAPREPGSGRRNRTFIFGVRVRRREPLDHPGSTYTSVRAARIERA